VKPHVDSTAFGRITIEGRAYDHDVVIAPSGEIANRWTTLPNPAGSHRVTLDDAERLLAYGAPRLVIGAGQSGLLRLSPEARTYLQQHGCEVILAPTPQAIEAFNAAAEPVTALLHLTC
jgi:hypothetical protein